MFPLPYIIFIAQLLLLFALLCATACINYNQSFLTFQFYFLILRSFLFFSQLDVLIFVHFSSFIFYYIELSHN